MYYKEIGQTENGEIIVSRLTRLCFMWEDFLIKYQTHVFDCPECHIGLLAYPWHKNKKQKCVFCDCDMIYEGKRVSA